MDYKDTLFLPTTTFSMRANLAENEEHRFKKWFDENYAYNKMCDKRINAKTSFILHDGPPYANGHIHIGHALNKILKDTIIKTHYFNGEKVTNIPGWDCHGLPIEQQVESKLGQKKKTLSKKEIREFCRAHAKEFVNIQKEEFKALGVLADWDHPYIIMDYKFESSIYRLLCKIAQKGLLIERSKPVFWSWAAQSALAEAEVEYEDKEDYSIFVGFDLAQDALDKLGVKSAKAVIWTTTPWTLPANQAIALNPNEIYVLSEDGLIFAKPLFKNMVENGLSNGNVLKEFKAAQLENLHAINPLNQRNSRFVLANHVLMDGGSGLVHTAPGHGEDDYYVCLKYKIEVLMPVDDYGCYDETLRIKGLFRPEFVDEFVGVHVFDANDRILELLGDNLLKCSRFTHSYPFCWRTHKPIIYRATKQWFIAMDEAKLNDQTLRQVATNGIQKVRFYPESGINRIGTMVTNRPDWCISRQRDWGTPIAFFRDKNTKEIILDSEVLDHIASIFDEYGTDVWWDFDIATFLPANSKYDPNNLEKVYDILDVWFDSGSTWNAVLNKDSEYPADMYLEGSDQHRGWFQSSLLLSSASNEKPPYKNVLTHGFTVDEKGQKMSKSKGNVIDPKDIAKTYGIEVLRLWILLSDYSSDLKISNNILKYVSEQYKKIRNTIRFLLANTNDLEFIETNNFSLIDKWILSKASKVFNSAKNYFDSYNFVKGYNLLLNFLIVDLSGIYLDICKDRLYCDTKNSNRRISSQSTMALIAKHLLILIAPTLTYTVDEALEHANPLIKGKAKDVFDIVYEDGFNFDFNIEDELLLKAREKFFEQIDILKKNKVIKNTLELNLQTSTNELLAQNLDDIEDWFMVSNITNKDQEETLASFYINDQEFKIYKSTLHKCPRCWKFKAKNEDSLCPRCDKALKTNNE